MDQQHKIWFEIDTSQIEDLNNFMSPEAIQACVNSYYGLCVEELVSNYGYTESEAEAKLELIHMKRLLQEFTSLQLHESIESVVAEMEELGIIEIKKELND